MVNRHVMVKNREDETVSTDALINGLGRLGLGGDAGGDAGGVNGVNGVNGINGEAEGNPFLDSTTSYLEFDRLPRHNNVSRFEEVSESTMEIRNNQPHTPLRRTVSGSSLVEKSTPELLATEKTRRKSRRRSSTSPEQQQMRQGPISKDLLPSLPPPSPQLNIAYLHTLLSQLPDQERYNTFKGILTHYLTILAEHEVNTSSDRFIITIHNQLKSHSRTKLEKIIDIFINDPSNLAMALSRHLYLKECELKKNFFDTWLIKKRKTRESNKSWEIWMIYQRKKYLTQWIYKYKTIEEDLVANADMFSQVRQRMKVWDIWKSNFQQQQQLNSVADYQNKSKFFNLWRDKIQIDYDDADFIYQQNLTISSLKKWKLQAKAQDSMQRVKLKLVLNKWKQQSDYVQMLEEDSKHLERVFHAGFFFSKWKKKSQVTISKTNELKFILNEATKSTFFKKWQTSMYFKSIEKQTFLKRDSILSEFIFKQWVQRLQQKQFGEAFQLERDKQIISKYLQIWIRQLTFKEKIPEVGSSIALRSCMKLWKLTTNRRIFEQTRDYKNVKSSFDNWLKQSRLKILANDYDSSLMNKYWDKLVLKKYRYENSLDAGTEAYESYSKVIYFNNWKVQKDKIDEMNEQADDFHKGIFFKKLKKKYQNIKSLQQRANDFNDKQISKTMIKLKFKYWSTSYETKIEFKLNSKISNFETDNNKSKLKVIFQTWKSQYQSYLSQEQLFKEEFQKEILLQPVFNKWISQYNDIKDMESKANEMNNLNLISSGFTKIQLAFFKVQELELKYIEHEDDSQAQLILKYLNIWSLKLLKIKRDNENISSFQRRWNRAHCRAILLLWHGKILDKNRLEMETSRMDIDGMGYAEGVDIGNDIDEDDIDDDDPSPLRTKSSKLKSSLLRGTQTPKKSIFGSSGRSPLAFGTNLRNQSSIPASERIKRQRMDALRNHFSQAKYAIPSPVRSELKYINQFKDGNTSSGIIGNSSKKKLDFTTRSILNPNITNEFMKYEENNSNNNNENIPNDYYDDDYDDDGDGGGNMISSPVISHRKINQKFGNIGGFNLSRIRSDSDGLSNA